MDEHGIDSSSDGQDAIGGLPDENNLNDVIEVIQTDPDFNINSSNQRGMFSGGGHTDTATTAMPSRQQHAHVRIVEQPASKALRFRYECEGRSAGSIPGASSSPENKTFPSIQIVGYKGRAVVVVSCVTKDPPYRPHPHNLVGREGCRRGVCTLEVSPETMSVTFSNLGIQCVKKKDIEAALRVREEIRVDPFRKGEAFPLDAFCTGFSHRNQPTSIDLNAVRLCFQVFIEGKEKNKFTVPLTPVVSEPIYDKKAMSDLVIVKLSDCVSSVDGGRKDIILLCEKVAKEDIQVRFYELKDGQVVWEAFGDFQPSQVHKQTAIWFRPPPYKTREVTEPVKVFIQLRRPSDNATSEPLPFELLPLDSESRRKKPRYNSDSQKPMVFDQIKCPENNITMLPPFMNIAMDGVKMEPRDTSPNPYLVGGYGGISPMYVGNPSISPNFPTMIDPLQPSSSQGMDINMSANSLQILPPIPENKTWNIASASVIHFPNDLGAATGLNIDPSSGLISLLDLDTNQPELKELRSSELATLNILDATNNLSENLSMNLSLSDIGILPNTDNNMTDSLTRLANTTLDNIVKLNEMCKPDN